MVKSIERALGVRNDTIANLTKQMNLVQNENLNIGSSLELNTYFKQNYPNHYEQFMFRLSAFWREDEYVDDNFIKTGHETLEELYQLKRELKECGKPFVIIVNSTHPYNVETQNLAKSLSNK